MCVLDHTETHIHIHTYTLTPHGGCRTGRLGDCPACREVPPTRRAGKAYRYCTAIDNGVDTPLSLAREMLNRRRCARQLAARRGHRRAGEDRRTQLMMMIMG